METRREGGTGGGVAMGTDSVCVHVCVCADKQVCEGARYPVRPGSALCVLPPGAFGTSLVALLLSPVVKRTRVGERGGEIWSYRTRKGRET